MAIAFLFPGQGSAEVGMGAELFEREPLVSEYFGRVSAVLGRDLKAITLTGPEETLVATENAQPAIFALSAACFDLFGERCPLAADFYAGLRITTRYYSTARNGWIRVRLGGGRIDVTTKR